MKRFYAFYVQAIGNQRERKEFDDEAEMLDLVRRANEPENTIRDLVVVFGERLDFEPYEKVVAWKVKE